MKQVENEDLIKLIESFQVETLSTTSLLRCD